MKVVPGGVGERAGHLGREKDRFAEASAYKGAGSLQLNEVPKCCKTIEKLCLDLKSGASWALACGKLCVLLWVSILQAAQVPSVALII